MPTPEHSGRRYIPVEQFTSPMYGNSLRRLDRFVSPEGADVGSFGLLFDSIGTSLQTVIAANSPVRVSPDTSQVMSPSFERINSTETLVAQVLPDAVRINLYRTDGGVYALHTTVVMPVSSAVYDSGGDLYAVQRSPYQRAKRATINTDPEARRFYIATAQDSVRALIYAARHPVDNSSLPDL